MNKRLIILFACLAVVILVVILATVVFTVRNVEVLVPDQWESQFDKALIVKSSKIKINSSIFSVSEKTAIKLIEEAVPYAKVITIERVFPSTVRINIIRRDPIMAIKLGDTDNYAMLDREFKVVEIITSSALMRDQVTVIDGYSHIADDYNITGNYISTKAAPLSKIADVIKACETVDIINSKLPIFADSIDLTRENYLIIRTVKGINIALKTDANPIGELFGGLYGVFVSSNNQHDTSKYITNSAGGIVVLSEEEFYK